MRLAVCRSRKSCRARGLCRVCQSQNSGGTGAAEVRRCRVEQPMRGAVACATASTRVRGGCAAIDKRADSALSPATPKRPLHGVYGHEQGGRCERRMRGGQWGSSRAIVVRCLGAEGQKVFRRRVGKRIETEEGRVSAPKRMWPVDGQGKLKHSPFYTEHLFSSLLHLSAPPRPSFNPSPPSPCSAPSLPSSSRLLLPPRPLFPTTARTTAGTTRSAASPTSPGAPPTSSQTASRARASLSESLCSLRGVRWWR